MSFSSGSVSRFFPPIATLALSLSTAALAASNPAVGREMANARETEAASASRTRQFIAASYGHFAYQLPVVPLDRNEWRAGDTENSAAGTLANGDNLGSVPTLFATGEVTGGAEMEQGTGRNTFVVGSGPIQGAISGFKAAWDRGEWDLYLSGYAWHLPGSYTAARRAKLNSTTWGGGIGRSIDDTDGNRHMIFLLATQDSHYKPEYFAAYCWQHPLLGDSAAHFDFGISAFLFSRVDVEDGVPLPGLLPYLAVGSKRVQVMVLYVPPIGDLIGGQTVYFFARVQM